jgi:hypothetical protein
LEPVADGIRGPPFIDKGKARSPIHSFRLNHCKKAQNAHG